jgi:hypothetical protein
MFDISCDKGELVRMTVRYGALYFLIRQCRAVVPFVVLRDAAYKLSTKPHVSRARKAVHQYVKLHVTVTPAIEGPHGGPLVMTSLPSTFTFKIFIRHEAFPS